MHAPAYYGVIRLLISMLLLVYTMARHTTTVTTSATLSTQQSLCPTDCKCRYQNLDMVAADCSRLHLQSIPHNLPDTLQSLNLSKNLISEITPSQLTNLTNLRFLSLQGNRIKNLESNLFTRTWRLESLDVSDNQLNKLQPYSFRNLTSLRSLNLRNNSLRPHPETYPDSVFQDLCSLKELNLKSNSISVLNSRSNFCYPDVALSKLHNLEKLHIDGLPYCIVGFGFRNLSKLNVLDFGNSIRHICMIETLPEMFFSNLTTMEDLEVDLLNCYIQSIHPQAFSHVPSMTSLILAGNHYLNFDQFAIASTSFPSTRLKKLDISAIKKSFYSNLTSEHIKKLKKTSLESLIMRNNYFTNIDIGVPPQLPRTLKFWDISDNKLRRADFLITWAFLINLEIVNMSVQAHNTFYSKNENDKESVIVTNQHSLYEPGNVSWESGGHFPASKLFPVPALELFNNANLVTHKNISFPPRSKGHNNVKITIGQWIKLASTFCPSHSFATPMSMYNKTVHFTAPAWLNHLRNLSDDNRKKIMGKRTLVNKSQSPFPRNLRQVHGSDMKLGLSISELTITGNNVLYYVNISSNFLWCFDGPVIGLSSMKVLDLSKNYAIALNPMFFSSMGNLRMLNLQYNSIGTSLELDMKCETFSSLKYLEYLDLSNSGLYRLYPDTFRNNSRLKELYLKYNALNELSLHLYHMPYLEHLDLSYNDLTMLSEINMKDLDVIERMSGNMTVNLFNNPLVCECSSLEFLWWFQKTRVEFAQRDNYRCKFVNGSFILMRELDESIGDLWRICHGQSFLLAALILFFIMIITGTAMAMFSYYQYNLYYYIYVSKQRFFFHVREDKHKCMQDVFLVFDDQDIQWRRHVLDVLLPNLEHGGITYHVSEVGAHEPTAGRPIWEVVEESILYGRKTLVLLTKDIFLDEEHQLAVNMAKIVQDMTGSQILMFLGAQRLNISSLPAHLYRLLRSSRIIRYMPDNAQFWTQLINEIKQEK